jgi:AraC-like DNA-binding protein
VAALPQPIESAPARDAGLTVQALSTDALPERDRYPYWKEAVCDMFVGLECSRDAREPFEGTAVRRAVQCGAEESVSFIEVQSVPQKAVRSPRQIRRDRDAWLMLLVQTAGPAILRQDGHTAVLGPGDMVLFDSTRAYQFTFDAPFRQLVVKVPHTRLAARLPQASLWLGRPIISSSAIGRILAAHVAAVSAGIGSVPPAVRPALIDRTLDLIALTFAGAQHALGDQASTARRVLLVRAMQFLDAHLHDPALAPADIAAALGISAGYLHRLFQGVGTSVSGHIREQRLARCREELASPLHAGEHITEVALRWGFNDLPHFSRAFNARYGVSPREYRATRSGPRA